MDSSAVVKAVVREPDSGRLLRFLARHRIQISSRLTLTEVLRAIRRHDANALLRAREALDQVTLLKVSEDVLERAAVLEPATLRTLDAIHLASALGMASELSALVTYDRRLAEAAAALGLPVAAPA